mmetsp:Transcript_35163/g.100159  ORF Transcript_35163/g.100159 Transcript_35163/m.100159 type:complete len:294 (+) Transcript_35163:1788-2669(+)
MWLNSFSTTATFEVMPPGTEALFAESVFEYVLAQSPSCCTSKGSSCCVPCEAPPRGPKPKSRPPRFAGTDKAAAAAALLGCGATYCEELEEELCPDPLEPLAEPNPLTGEAPTLAMAAAMAAAAAAAARLAAALLAKAGDEAAADLSQQRSVMLMMSGGAVAPLHSARPPPSVLSALLPADRPDDEVWFHSLSWSCSCSFSPLPLPRLEPDSLSSSSPYSFSMRNCSNICTCISTPATTCSGPCARMSHTACGDFITTSPKLPGRVLGRVPEFGKGFTFECATSTCATSPNFE